MPVDRPRRALPEEPDDVASYVAKRSRGFTQADSGDRIVVRPVRAARALEPSAVGIQTHTAESDLLGFSDSDAPRPRRALPAEPLRWIDLDEPIPPDVAMAGRRAIVDLEQSHSSEPALPSPLAQLLAEPDVAVEAPEPRRSLPLPPLEPVTELPKNTVPPPLPELEVERPKITVQEVRPPEPMPVPVQPATPIAAPVRLAAAEEQTQPYRPAPPIDRPAVPLRQTQPVARPTPQVTRAVPTRQALTVRPRTSRRRPCDQDRNRPSSVL